MAFNGFEGILEHRLRFIEKGFGFVVPSAKMADKQLFGTGSGGNLRGLECGAMVCFSCAVYAVVQKGGFMIK